MDVSDSKLYLQKVHRVRGEFPVTSTGLRVTSRFRFHSFTWRRAATTLKQLARP